MSRICDETRRLRQTERMLRPMLLGVLASALVVTGAAGGTVAPSGLHGVVLRGPNTPVCQVGVPCEERAAGVVLTFTRRGIRARAVRTTAAGRYRVRLPAGLYTVRTSERPFGVVPAPSRARVIAGRFRRVDFHIDTGIR